MDLSTYSFPKELNKRRFASRLNTTEELIEEAKKRNPIKGMREFDKVFFLGGQIELKEDVKGTWKENALVYARGLMVSDEPKHEDKEIVIGMIFEECLVL